MMAGLGLSLLGRLIRMSKENGDISEKGQDTQRTNHCGRVTSLSPLLARNNRAPLALSNRYYKASAAEVSKALGPGKFEGLRRE